MTIRVAINGLGRIGRLFCRDVFTRYREKISIVAVNDLVPGDHLAYLLKYDTVHGRWAEEVHGKQDQLLIGQQEVRVFTEKDPSQLPWKELQVDVVLEATGRFLSREDAGKHLTAGASRVVISAPPKGDIPLFVMGVNHRNYRREEHRIISNASCTTNCLAPMMKVLLEHFGVEEGLMTTIHSLTASQTTLDGPSKKDWRGGRAASCNIIPASTGAAGAVGLCLPELQGKLTGMAFRVPTADVSVVDLTVRLKKKTDYKSICEAFQEAAEGDLQGILSVCYDPVVSSDFIGSCFSTIIDAGAGIGLSPTFYKLVAWYDNEVGYAARLSDLVLYTHSA